MLLLWFMVLHWLAMVFEHNFMAFAIFIAVVTSNEVLRFYFYFYFFLTFLSFLFLVLEFLFIFFRFFRLQILTKIQIKVGFWSFRIDFTKAETKHWARRKCYKLFGCYLDKWGDQACWVCCLRWWLHNWVSLIKSKFDWNRCGPLG
jgi:hypothetical protein